MSCGAAFFDYDNDGWLDILVLTGSRFGDPPADCLQAPLQEQPRRHVHRRDQEAPGCSAPDTQYGVTVGDYNNDGFEDLFITGWGQNTLYRNNGDGTFTDVTKEAGLLERAAPLRFRLHVRGLRSRRPARPVRCQLRQPSTSTRCRAAGQSKSCNAEGLFCGPRGLALRRATRSITTTATAHSPRSRGAAGIGKAAGGYGLTAVAADFDNDGWPDIYVACDSTPSLMFRNNHDGTFTEQGLETGVALSDDGMVQAGMGLGIGDFRLDGNLDIVKTHFSGDTPAVYLNNGKGNFRDGTLRSGLAVETRFVDWGVGVADLDNDGNPDIFVVTGGIYPELRDDYNTPRVVFRNLGNGRFEELLGQAGPGVDATAFQPRLRLRRLR